MSGDEGLAARVNTSTLLLLVDGGVLLVEKGGRAALPVLETRGHWHAETAPLNRAVAERFGLRATVLRVLAHERDQAANRTTMTVLLQCRRRAPQGVELPGVGPPAGTRIAAIEEAAALLTDGARTAFDEWRGGDGPPWSRAGWFDEAAAWATDRLRERGRRVTGDVEQIKQWSIASIMRIPAASGPSASGDVWFKAVPPMFAHEGALIELIGPSMPDALPRAIAIDRARGWTLMEPLPPVELQPGHSGEQYEQALRLLARIQQHWAGREHDLLAAGCADRQPETIAGGLRELLARPALRERLGEHAARLDAFAETVPERCAELAACGVPVTLMHGDFHAANVAVDGEDGGRMVIFDWTDGCVSHPFFDLVTFLPEEPVERAALVLAYLEAWTARVPMRQLERAWELAEPLAMAHHAISYMRIMDGIKQSGWEFSSDDLFWLRWLRELEG